jgi:hypothetical protein
MAGNVDMVFDGLGSSAAHIKGGRIKALMVAGSKRNPAFPDVPCAAELGLPDYNVVTWYGLWAPKGTPAELQAQIVEHVRQLGQSDDIKAAWAKMAPSFPRHAAAIRRLRQQRDQALGGGGQGLGREARLTSNTRIPQERARMSAQVRVEEGFEGEVLPGWCRSRCATRASSTPCRDRCGAPCARPLGLQAREDVRCVILRGEGGHFCAGGDISEYPDFRFDEAALRHFHEVEVWGGLSAMLACDVPLVACIEGNCMGAGVEMASAATPPGGPVGAFRRADRPLGFPMAPRELALVRAAAGELTVRQMLLEAATLDAPTLLARGF